MNAMNGISRIIDNTTVSAKATTASPRLTDAAFAAIRQRAEAITDPQQRNDLFALILEVKRSRSHERSQAPETSQTV